MCGSLKSVIWQSAFDRIIIYLQQATKLNPQKCSNALLARQTGEFG
jgi:hypothetical protein